MSQLPELPISKLPARLPRQDLWQMLRLVRTLYRLSRKPAYRQLVFQKVPEIAHFDPGHDALMMGYDFHLSASGPRLIEVNTNAGGGYIAWLSEAQSHEDYPIVLSERIQIRLLESFFEEWRNFAGAERALKSIAILDENPTEQALYPEMIACRDWLREQGFWCQILPPEQLKVDPQGLAYRERRIDLIYNRHCDFFLEDSVLAGVRKAYLAKQVCLSPNPFAYGLLADKRRMILWSNPEQLEQLPLGRADRKLLVEMIPHSRLLAECDPEAIWEARKGLVFKPVTRFGSRGVLLGKGITRKRFATLDPFGTLVQNLVVPSVEEDQEAGAYKVDLRLFVYRDRLLGVGARLYQGQVTNLRTEGGGFAPIRLV